MAKSDPSLGLYLNLTTGGSTLLNMTGKEEFEGYHLYYTKDRHLFSELEDDLENYGQGVYMSPNGLDVTVFGSKAGTRQWTLCR